MIDKRDGETKKPMPSQERFPQSNPDRLPKGEPGKSGKKGK
ncbi:hypothetical protein [Pseudomonas sp. GL-RE-20]|nr:hypothetical protein [Pseudomonas sp. GL-RE-20]